MAVIISFSLIFFVHYLRPWIAAPTQFSMFVNLLLFCTLFEAMNCCTHTVLNVCESSSFLYIIWGHELLHPHSSQWLWIFFLLHVMYNLSMSSLRCKALCIIISFLILLLMFLSFSFLHFKKGQVFISLIKFLLQNLVSSSFFVLRKYSFLDFSFLFVWLIVSASHIPIYSFSLSILILSWLSSSIPLFCLYFFYL